MASQVPALGINPLAYEGVEAVNPANVILATRNPTVNDLNQANGSIWINQTTLTAWIKGNGANGQAQWIAIGTGATGGITTITGDSGGAENPLAGNFNLLGTANQITVTGSTNTETFSLPSAITTPGSLTTTTTVTAGTGITATTGNITATNGNIIINGTAKQLQVEGGAVTDFVGTAVLVGGTVTIANTNIAATDRIIPFRVAVNASTGIGNLSSTISAGVSFTIDALDATGGVDPGDLSTIGYFIFRQL